MNSSSIGRSHIDGLSSASVRSIGESTSVTDEEDFRLPAEQVKRLKRAEKINVVKKRQIVKGSGNAYKTLKGREPLRDVYVYRLDKQTTEADLQEFLSENGVSAHALIQQSQEDWNTKSFKVTISHSSLEKVMIIDWPENVCIRRWRNPFRNNNPQK
jgi:hypothetical protein